MRGRCPVWVTFCLVLLAFACGCLASGGGRAPAPDAPDTFIDEMIRINVEYCARIDASTRAHSQDREAHEQTCRAWRLLHDEKVRACYRRHGKELPPGLK